MKFMEWFLNRQIWNRLQEQLAAKQDSPENEGSAGQVLGLALRDGHLLPVWITVSGGGITIDDALSTISENPVQNKVITAAVNDLSTAAAGKVDDVQVNGTSVVSQGVANIPYGSASDAGVVQVSNTFGLQMSQNQGSKIGRASCRERVLW